MSKYLALLVLLAILNVNIYVKSSFVKYKMLYMKKMLLTNIFMGNEMDVRRRKIFPGNSQELLGWQRNHSAQILGDITVTFQSLGNVSLPKKKKKNPSSGSVSWWFSWLEQGLRELEGSWLIQGSGKLGWDQCKCGCDSLGNILTDKKSIF